jgi:hypothetical protein
VISVTATDVNDKLFNDANRGRYIAVAAPGVDILVPAPDSTYQLSTPEVGSSPVLAAPNPRSTLHRRFAGARLSQPCLPETRPGVSTTLTTIALDDSSLR